MFSTLKNAFADKEIRKKIFFHFIHSVSLSDWIKYHSAWD